MEKLSHGSCMFTSEILRGKLTLKILEIILFDKWRNWGPGLVKWLVPKHTSQSVAEAAGPRVWAHLSVRALGRASSLWARPHGTPPRPIHEEMGFASSIAVVLSIPFSYSNVLFQPDIEMRLKNYVQDPRENIFTSNQRGLRSCHKRQWESARTSLSAE